MTPKPLNSEPPQGPVEGRGVAEIRADLACCDRDGVPWSAAARRLLADVPSLLAEVEAAHRFEQSVAVEREALLAEAEGLRRELTAVGDAFDDLTESWHELFAERDSLRGAIEQALADWDNRGTGGASNIFGDLSAALAAAADAPQPATRCDHGKTKAHQMTDSLGVYANCPGPVSHE